MYREQDVPDETILWDSIMFRPLITLISEWGGRCQVVKDDNCYVLLLRSADQTYRPTLHWFREAAEALGRYILDIGRT